MTSNTYADSLIAELEEELKQVQQSALNLEKEIVEKEDQLRELCDRNLEIQGKIIGIREGGAPDIFDIAENKIKKVI